MESVRFYKIKHPAFTYLKSAMGTRGQCVESVQKQDVQLQWTPSI